RGTLRGVRDWAAPIPGGETRARMGLSVLVGRLKPEIFQRLLQAAKGPVIRDGNLPVWLWDQNGLIIPRIIAEDRLRNAVPDSPRNNRYLVDSLITLGCDIDERAGGSRDNRG